MSRPLSTWLAAALLAGCSASAADRPAPAEGGSVAEGGVPAADAARPDGQSAGDGGLTSDGAPAQQGDGQATPTSRVLLGYYATWTSTFLPATSIDWKSVTHVAQAFALPKSGGGLENEATFPDDPLVQTAHANGVKVIASVGGASAPFDKAAVDPKARAVTVGAIAALCAQHGYDGIDIDWEFPTASTVSAWASFLDELRVALDGVGPGLTLSSTIAQGAANGDILPVASLSKLSWVGIMSYRYTGPTDAVVGFYAPLAAPATAEDGSVTATVRHLVVDRGIAPSKLLLGLGFYGEQFKDGPPGTAISSPSTVSPVDQASIAALIGSPGWSLTWDPTASEPSLASGKTWVSYENTQSIDAKCAFAHAQGLGGAMIWHMASGVLADGTQPLMPHAAGCR